MDKLQSINKVVACTPFKNKGPSMKIESAFGTYEQKSSFEKLQVLFGAADLDKGPYLAEGTSVLVRAEDFRANWANAEYEYEGVKFILVPLQFIVFVEVPQIQQRLPLVTPRP